MPWTSAPTGSIPSPVPPKLCSMVKVCAGKVIAVVRHRRSRKQALLLQLSLPKRARRIGRMAFLSAPALAPIGAESGLTMSEHNATAAKPRDYPIGLTGSQEGHHSNVRLNPCLLRLLRFGRLLVSWFRLHLLHFLTFVSDPGF